MKAMILIHTLFTLWMDNYYNPPTLTKFLAMQHRLCGEDHQSKQKGDAEDKEGKNAEKARVTVQQSGHIWHHKKELRQACDNHLNLPYYCVQMVIKKRKQKEKSVCVVIINKLMVVIQVQ
jgi:hypothetical protein